jgi:hypothetical protein
MRVDMGIDEDLIAGFNPDHVVSDTLDHPTPFAPGIHGVAIA